MAGPTGPPIAPPYQQQQHQQQWDGQEGFPLPPDTALKETVQRFVLASLVSVSWGWDMCVRCVWKDLCTPPPPILPLQPYLFYPTSSPPASNFILIHVLASVPVNSRYLDLCLFPTATFLAERLYAQQPTGTSSSFPPSLPPSHSFSSSLLSFFSPHHRFPSSPAGDVPREKRGLERRPCHPTRQQPARQSVCA